MENNSGEWNSLPEVTKLAICIIGGIIVFAMGALFVVGPMAWAIKVKSLKPLLLYIPELGAVFGACFYADL